METFSKIYLDYNKIHNPQLLNNFYTSTHFIFRLASIIFIAMPSYVLFPLLIIFIDFFNSFFLSDKSIQLFKKKQS